MIALALLLPLLAQSAQSAVDPAIARGEKIFAQSCSVGYCHGVAGAAGPLQPTGLTAGATRAADP
jgi:mono/diheme cytochrome c family protein